MSAFIQEERAERRQLASRLEIVKLAAAVAAVGLVIFAATSLIAHESFLCFLYLTPAYAAFEIQMIASNLQSLIEDPIKEASARLTVK